MMAVPNLDFGWASLDQLDFGDTSFGPRLDHRGDSGTRQILDLLMRFPNDEIGALAAEGYLAMSEETKRLNSEWEEIDVIPPEY